MLDSLEATFAALRPLLGRWEGTGRAAFPTIPPHEYVETFRVSGEPDRLHLHFEQRARHRPVGTDTYGPSHWESGFLRVIAPGTVELTNAQDNGRLEVARLTVEERPDALTLRGATTRFLNDPRMVAAERLITVTPAELHYTLRMATTQVPGLTGHLEATLRRVGPDA